MNLLVISWHIRRIIIKRRQAEIKPRLSIESVSTNSQKFSKRYSIAEIVLDNSEEESIEKIKATSMDKLILVLAIIETIISILWIVNIAIFEEASQMQEKFRTCFFYSLITVFMQGFDWTFFMLCLYNFLRVIENPIEEFAVSKRIKFYFLICLVCSSVFTAIVYLSQSFGVSPMLTCFIRNNTDNESAKKIGIHVVMAIPLLYMVYISYLLLMIYRKRTLVTSLEMKISFYKMVMYTLLYMIFYFPLFFFYIFTIDYNIKENTFESWTSYYCSLSSIIMNMSLGIGRALEYFSKLKLTDFKIFKLNGPESNELKSENSNSVNANFAGKRNLSVLMNDSFLDNFLRDLFVGIILSLAKAKEKLMNIEKAVMNKHITEEIENTFDSLNMGENMKYFTLLEPSKVIEGIPVYVKVIDHAPKIFKKIRILDGVTEDSIMNSLLDIKINSLTKGSGGKSGALFLTTADNQFLIKTMDDYDFQSILTESFLTYYLLHLESNPNSFICRFYGVFTIKADANSTPFRLILMRNLKGPFKRLIRLTYDLKGSTMNREVKIPDSIKGTPEEYFEVRKDINFEKELKFLNLVDQDKFIRTIKADAEFFEDLEIMDYSLFIFQIKYNDKKLEALKNNKIFEFYLKNFYESHSINRCSINESETDNEHVGYVIMIIDYLQRYTIDKKFEQGFKGIFKQGIASSAHPKEYCQRFIQFCQKIAQDPKLTKCSL